MEYSIHIFVRPRPARIAVQHTRRGAMQLRGKKYKENPATKKKTGRTSFSVFLSKTRCAGRVGECSSCPCRFCRAQPLTLQEVKESIEKHSSNTAKWNQIRKPIVGMTMEEVVQSLDYYKGLETWGKIREPRRTQVGF